MLARGGGHVLGGRGLEELDVGHEAGAGEQGLEQVVAQQRVVGHAPRERRLEGVDVVDALAGIGALPEEILVDIRHGRRVRVDAR